MRIFTQKADILNFILEKKESATIGFVPTMGALHHGHRALFELCRAQNEVAVASIFVNPMQFNNPDDLQKYPRTPEADLAMLEAAGFDAVFIPDAEKLFEGEAFPQPDLGTLNEVMEGKFRPGHFEGVYKIVWLLFRYVRPHRAYFGQKDYQQLAVIRRMVQQEDLPVEVIGCPTVREADGLAMSSRNMRLDAASREKAAAVSRYLLSLQRHFTLSAAEMKAAFEALTRSLGFEPEYIELADAATLQPLERFSGAPAVICMAYYAGPVRLIDNVTLN